METGVDMHRKEDGSVDVASRALGMFRETEGLDRLFTTSPSTKTGDPYGSHAIDAQNCSMVATTPLIHLKLLVVETEENGSAKRLKPFLHRTSLKKARLTDRQCNTT